MAKTETRTKSVAAANGTARGSVEAGGKSQRRRQELIDAAAKIFQDKGYEAASIQDVADALGILKGSVYYYIDSKEDLLFAAIQEVHESALANMEVIRHLDVDTMSLIRLFIESHVKHVSDNLVKATVFFHDFRSLDPKRHEYIISERDSYDAFLRELIIRGQQEGVICKDVDPKLATLAILGMMNWTYQWYRVGGNMDSAAIGRQFADFALAGMACDPATHKAKHRTQLGKIPANVTLGHGGQPVIKEPRKRVAAK
jgi:AcrR family transcriptional regulator